MRRIVLFLLCSGFSFVAFAQTAKPAAGTASVSGRVTITGKPVAGATVSAMYAGAGDADLVVMTMQGGENVQARTDAEGRFELTALRKGKYRIKCISDAYVEQTANGFTKQANRTYTVDEGEQLKNVDFALVRGGVITGRVTDAEGKPLIEEMMMFEAAASPFPNHSYDSEMRTDDRGVYRFFGLAPGQYRVVVGLAEGASPWRTEPIPRTYAPGVTNVAEAKVIEVKAGSEIENIDIRIGRDDRRFFTASGKVVDGETGQAFSNNFIVYAEPMQTEESPGQSPTGSSSVQVDASGAFALARLTPGRYRLRLDTVRNFTDPFAYYGEPLVVTMSESDVSGLELKVRRGATVSGKAVLDATTGNDANLLAGLSQNFISMRSHHEQPIEQNAGYFHYAQLKPDHSFRFEGVPPGKMLIEGQRFSMNGSAPSGLTLVRVERDGVPQPNGITITGAETIANVRLVFALGTGAIRGEVKAINGALPTGYSLHVSAMRKGEGPQSGGFDGAVDDKGRFRIENLLAGEYTLRINAFYSNWQEQAKFPPFSQEVKESVTVSANQPTQVALTFDVSRKEQQ